MALVEDSGADRKETLAKANVLAQNSEYCSSSSRSRRASLSCVVGLDFHPCPGRRRHRCCLSTTSTAVACCWSRLLSFSLVFGYSTFPKLSHLYHGWWSRRTPSWCSRAGCLWRSCWAPQIHLSEREKWSNRSHMERAIVLPKCGRVTVMELLDPAWRVASLCTSTLAGLKSSERVERHGARKWKVKMWQKCRRWDDGGQLAIAYTWVYGTRFGRWGSWSSLPTSILVSPGHDPSRFGMKWRYSVRRQINSREFSRSSSFGGFLMLRSSYSTKLGCLASHSNEVLSIWEENIHDFEN